VVYSCLRVTLQLAAPITARARWRVPVWALFAVTAALPRMGVAAQLAPPQPRQPGRLAVDAISVPLNPQDPAAITAGDFEYAGGLVLTSSQTNLLHELSDIILVGPDRFVAVGDEGTLLEARLVLDDSGRLAGVADADISRLIGEDGKPVFGPDADAEGLALLPMGDRIVSFETRARILRYPKAGGPPRRAPSPRVPFPPAAGMEALTARPDLGVDAYMVGSEDSGETWVCRLRSLCLKGPTIDKPREYGLVAMTWISEGTIAYLLRAYDPVHGVRITMTVRRGTAEIARMDLAAPMTVDNFEGLTSMLRPDGKRRFYLISDDNNRASERTLLMAFDWVPR
jgi:hypothetical protein